MDVSIGDRIHFDEVPGVPRYTSGFGTVTSVYGNSIGAKVDVDGSEWDFDNGDFTVVNSKHGEWKVVTEAQADMLDDVFGSSIERRIQVRINTDNKEV